MTDLNHGVIPPEFYGEAYWHGEKSAHGGYAGCKWEGWSYLITAIKELFNPESITDAGCGLGPLMCEAEKQGIGEVFGFDFSGYAVNEKLHPNAHYLDITKKLKLEEFEAFSSDIICCFSVLEHIAETSLLNALQNLQDLTGDRGILLLKIDLLEMDWPEANGVNPADYFFDATLDDKTAPLAQALIQSGHQTIKPINAWDMYLRKNLSLQKRDDLTSAIISRCGNKLKWETLWCFTNRKIPRRLTVWAIQRANEMEGKTVYERLHQGDIVGSCGYDNVRDQMINWEKTDCPEPQFLCHQDHLETIQMRFPFATDYVVVGDYSRALPDPWKQVSIETFKTTRPFPRY